MTRQERIAEQITRWNYILKSAQHDMCIAYNQSTMTKAMNKVSEARQRLAHLQHV